MTTATSELQFVLHHLKSAENGFKDLQERGDKYVERWAIMEAESRSLAERTAQTMREMDATQSLP